MGWTGGRQFNLQYKFGDKTVTIHSHIHHWSIPIPFLLSLYLFGENFDKLNTVAVVKTTKKTRLIHIWSNECAMSLLSIENKNAVQFMKKDKMYYACAKIGIVITKPNEYHGGTNGYVIGETRTKWVVKTANDLELLVTPPRLTFPIIDNETNRRTYRWVFQNDSYKQFRFFVQEKYPIQMLITKKNDCTFLTYLMSRYVEDVTTSQDGTSVVEMNGALCS